MFGEVKSFGVEIECYMPESNAMDIIGDELRKMVAKRLTENGVNTVSQSYNHTVAPTWKVVVDNSVTGGHYRSLEIVSPPMPLNKISLDTIATVTQTLLLCGCTVNNSCGVHVHFGIEGNAQDKDNVAFLKRILKMYCKFENAINALMPVSRHDNRYCKSITHTITSRARNNGMNVDGLTKEEIAFKALDACNTLPKLRSTLYQDRYHKVNLEAIDRHNTIEFRQHSGTLNAEKIVNWIMLLSGLIDAAKNARLRPRNASTVLTQAQEVQRLFTLIEDPAVKTYYMRRYKMLSRRQTA
jgi:hypothetical protein